MVELHDLRPTPGSRSNRKRRGRGPGSGIGKTSGRGQKGQKSRSGGSIRRGFEGGQMPLQRRLPKRGFTPLRRVVYQVVNLRALDEIDETDITPEVLRSRGLIGSLKRPVKVLGSGDITRAVKVSAHAFSGSAKTKIETAGGTVFQVGR